MAPPPLLGFNNNVRHRGRVFHIQTEDSGVRHARIVTHLFADGGRIVGTRRLDYSRYLGQTDMVVALRRLMKDQHKAMFLALRAGELDGLIDKIFSEPAAATSVEPRPDAGQSLPVGTSVPALSSDGEDDLEPLRAGSFGRSDAVSTPASVPTSLQAALAHAASENSVGAHDAATASGRASDPAGASRPLASEGTRRAAVFGSGAGRWSPSIFNETPSLDASLGDAILSFLSEDTDRDASPK